MVPVPVPFSGHHEGAPGPSHLGTGETGPDQPKAYPQIPFQHKRGHPAQAGWPLRQCPTTRERLLVRSDGAGLVVVDVEDCVELGQLEKVVHLLGQTQQLESRALVARRGVSAYQLAQA